VLLAAPTMAQPQRRRGSGLAALVFLVGLSLLPLAHLQCSFVQHNPPTNLRKSSQSRSVVARQAGFEFGLKTADGHDGLLVEERGDGLRVQTNSDFTGGYNTVLGDKEVPAKGRSYFEVKIVKKPTDAWEYIGLADAKSDVTVPLSKNRKGERFFWGSTYDDSFSYSTYKGDKKWNTNAQDNAWKLWQSKAQSIDDIAQDMAKDKGMEKDIKGQVAYYWANEETMIGQPAPNMPPMKEGMVIGVDVDMDKGTLSYWADGEQKMTVASVQGGPLDIKGKKLVPAISVFGRTRSGMKQNTVMEVRTGLEPPSVPA